VTGRPERRETTTVCIGLVGAGAMGSLHAEAYGSIADVKIAAIYAPSGGRSSALAEKVGTVSTTDFDQLLHDPTIQAIDVCAPSARHQDVVVPALEAGKHVFCETPLALTLEDATKMRDVAREHDRLLLVGLLMRSVPEYVHIQRAVASGQLGKVKSIYAYRLGSYLLEASTDHKSHYSDPTTELMTFDFDVVNWLVGMPRDIDARAAMTADGSLGAVVANLGYPDKVVVVEASGMMPASFPFSVGLRVAGSAGALEVSTRFVGPEPTVTLSRYGLSGRGQAVALEERDPYAAELQHFVKCIRSQAEPAALDVDWAVEALRLSIATQRSLSTSSRTNV
jgi:UDP-N-acetylglucosamine 3-dehydrogenase